MSPSQHTPRTIPVINPATEEQLAEIPAASADQVERSVQAARRAYESWRRVPAT